MYFMPQPKPPHGTQTIKKKKKNCHKNKNVKVDAKSNVDIVHFLQQAHLLLFGE